VIRFFAPIAALVMASMLATIAEAQPRRLERSEVLQRKAVMAWTECIAAERREEAEQVLLLDYREDGPQTDLNELAQTRISQRCFNAMPRRYRSIRLSGLPFAGGLAEFLIENHPENLIRRLSMAAIGEEAQTFSYTDVVANCVVRGAPHLAAGVFATEVETPEELEALGQLQPVIEICTRGGAAIDASPLAMRSMLATASYRILAAQENATDGSEDDA